MTATFIYTLTLAIIFMGKKAISLKSGLTQ